MLYESLARWFEAKVILEGGRVFNITSSISQKVIPDTIAHLVKNVLSPLNILKMGEDWELLGSVGKKSEPSNDIDIAVVKPIHEIEGFIRDKGYEYRNLKGLNVLSFAYPVAGQEGKFVQIDLMPTDNLEYSIWAYHSPFKDESEYSGTYRNAVLESIASEADKTILSRFSDGSIKEIKKKYYSYSNGLMERIDSYEGKRGKPVKKPTVLERTVISKDPQEICEYLLGKGVTREDTNSFESVYARMQSEAFPHKEKIKAIKEKCVSILSRKKLNIPPELMDSKSKDTFKSHNMLEDVIKMPKVPHIEQMSIKQIHNFFTDGEYELSEKMDGANFSIGVIDGQVYGKSKKDKAKFDADYFYANKDLNDIYIGMGNLLKLLEQNEFAKWYKKKVSQTEFHKLQIFGEIFYSSQVNAIKYDPDIIGGKGGYVIFGIYADDADITNTVQGKKIINLFIRDFNQYTFPIWIKNVTQYTMEQNTINRLLNYIKINKDILTGHKRDPEFKEKKISAKGTVIKLLNSIKTNLLTQTADMKSMLGGDDSIEGLIIKNLKNNQMIKVVDIKRFGELNAKNWANRNELKHLRKGLFKELMSTVFNNSDIASLPTKQDESIRSYLSITHKKKFESEGEMLAVLVNDMNEEVELKDSVANMKSILNDYIEKLILMKDNIDITLDKKHYTDTDYMYKNEISEITQFIEKISKQKSPQVNMMKFMIGNKSFNTLKEKYLS